MGSHGGYRAESVCESSRAMGWSVLLGQCMFGIYLPMALINQTGRPAAVAVVATPILKLWLEYISGAADQQVGGHKGPW